ncbi:MAG TPA: OsmC family protein [Anaerolineales bacterium]|nr:OsmC family protein [Anaerolineales bacterium]
MKVTVNWKGDMTFAGESPSGFPVQMDSDEDFGGTKNGPRPMEMIALGLAGCTAMDVISILKKKRQELTQFDVKVNAPRSHNFPKVFTSAVITYIVSGKNINEAAVLRAIELTAGKYCPAQIMFSQVFPIDLHYEIYEEEGDGNQSLIHQGVWQEKTLE